MVVERKKSLIDSYSVVKANQDDRYKDRTYLFGRENNLISDEDKIIELIRNSPKVTKPMTAQTIGEGTTTVDKILKNSTQIKRQESKRSGYWTIE